MTDYGSFVVWVDDARKLDNLLGEASSYHNPDLGTGYLDMGPRVRIPEQHKQQIWREPDRHIRSGSVSSVSY